MRTFAALLTIASLLGMSSTAALADTSVSASIVGVSAGLTVTSPLAGALTATLNGADQTVYTTLSPLTVTDLRGTGTGWHVTFQASQLTTGLTTSHTLPLDSLSLASISASCATSVTCTGSASGLTTSTPIDHGSAVTVASATSGAGMGTYTLTPGDFAGHVGSQLALKVPAGAYAGSYSSTITVTIADLPS